MDDSTNRNEDYEKRFAAWKAKKSTMYHPITKQNTTDHVKEIPNKIEQILHLEHKPKLKLFLTFLAYLIPLAVLGILLSYIFAPFTARGPVTYSLDVATKGDMDKGNPIYLEQSKALSPPVQYGQETYREIVKPFPFYVNFKSPVKIPDNSKVVLSLDFIGTNANLLVDNESLYPSLENYELSKEFDNSYLYKRKDIVKKEGNEENPKDFLKNNYYGASIYSYLPLEVDYPVQGYEQKTTLIPNTFRGDLNLIFYTENGLELNFEKQDMNWYVGEDNYTVIIKDINENVIYSQFFEDDGDTLGQRNLTASKLNTIRLPELKGIYYVNFEGGRQADSSIKNIQINTNKVMLSKGFLVLDPMSFYIKNNFARNVQFYYWHEGGDQNITINQENFYLGREYDGITYNRQLLNGEYNISIQKGDLVINNNFVAKTKENWFDMELLKQYNLNTPDFILFNKEKIKFTKDGFIIYKQLTTEEDHRIELLASKKDQFKLRRIEVNIS